MDGCCTPDEKAARRRTVLRLRPWWHDEEGGATYEYAILVAVPAIGLAIVMTDFGWSLGVLYEFWVAAVVQVAATL